MREIKFRGQDLVSGNLLFGDLLHARGELLILEFGSKVARTVKKDSVAQLVGYDADGNEVYEDDELETKDGAAIYAGMLTLARVKRCRNGGFTDMAKENGWKLKG